MIPAILAALAGLALYSPLWLIGVSMKKKATVVLPAVLTAVLLCAISSPEALSTFLLGLSAGFVVHLAKWQSEVYGDLAMRESMRLPDLSWGPQWLHHVSPLHVAVYRLRMNKEAESLALLRREAFLRFGLERRK